ncbi:MAG: PAS domain-containing protein, partial [Luminiphilus sp.]|nr:PAS domain-containing protein [Luminiphilus sp.]
MNMMSELSSEALLQHLASIQLVVNESGIVVDAQVSGPSSTLQPEDIVGHHLPDLVDPSSKETVQAKLAEARRTPGTPIRCDT